MQFNRGMRDKLAKYVNIDTVVSVTMSTVGNDIYDYCCFGVDINGKLSDDRYMIFYNQTASPRNEITYVSHNNQTTFNINLSMLPSNIHKLVFTSSIDGNGTMGNISSHSVTMSQNGQQKINMIMQGKDFHSEKAIISVEIYRKDEWRIAAVANGFNGGLSALLSHFGGTEVVSDASEKQQTPSNTIPQVVVQPIQEKKKIQNTQIQNKPIESKPAPKKVSLVKGQKVSLSKEGTAPIIIENGWTAKGKDYDLKALVRYRNGKHIYIGAANSDEFLSTPDGAVKHGGDVKNPGELENIKIQWHKDIASVAVSSYSAIENGTGSFRRYGVYVRIKNGAQIIEIPAKDTSANDRSYTLCFGEIIFGDKPNTFEVSALELYSRPNSENRIGYKGSTVVMDIGPIGRTK